MSRTAVIAGVGPLLGDALARKFAAEGCRVGLFARSEEFIADLAADIEAAGGTALAVPTDVTDSEAVTAGFEAVREAFGPVETLVLNQSAPAGGPIDECDPAAFERTWRVRTHGSYLCVRAALADLRETGGTVLFSGTNYAGEPTPELVGWSSTAAATRGLARSLAAESAIHVAYVAIGGAVASPESTWDGAIGADAVAETYWNLVEQERGQTTELDLQPVRGPD
jgi:NAD(P)-dependent dehydrogenase (short-subunit alcohol dehydrogenase family)